MADAEERRFVEPRLAHLLGLEEHGPWERENLFSAWRLFYERLAEEMPTVMVFEDMEWADAALLDFIEYLVDWSRNHPLFVLVLARPELAERRTTWGAGSATSARSTSSRSRATRWRRCWPASCRGCPTSCARASASGPRASRSMPSRRCACCSTAASWSKRRQLLASPPGPIEDARDPRDAARADRRPPRRARRRRAAAAPGRSRCWGKTFTVEALCDAHRPAVLPRSSRCWQGSRARRCSRSRPIRSRRSAASTDSCRISCARVAYEMLSKHERRAKHLAAAAYGTKGEDELAEVVAGHYWRRCAPTPMLQTRRTSPAGPSRRCARRGSGRRRLRPPSRRSATTSRRPRLPPIRSSRPTCSSTRG